MQDIVLYLRGGENEELRYALRTWEQSLRFGKLVAVGGPCPDWFKPDIMVQNTAKFNKMEQCYDNLVKVLSLPDLSDDVIIMMDDIFLLKYVGDWTINYNRGTLQEHLERSTSKSTGSAYDDQLKYTCRKLSYMGYTDPLSFEEHAPFLCNKDKLLTILKSYSREDMNKFLFRSAYGNIYRSPTKFKLDCKVSEPNGKFNSSEVVVSTNDVSFKHAAGEIIKNWYPNKSRFER